MGFLSIVSILLLATDLMHFHPGLPVFSWFVNRRQLLNPVLYKIPKIFCIIHAQSVSSTGMKSYKESMTWDNKLTIGVS